MRLRFPVCCLLAAAAASSAAGASPPSTPDAPAAAEWPAMGTRIRLLVRGPGAEAALPAMAAAARDAIEAVEAETSAFRPSSSLSRVSAAAGSGDWIPVAPPFDAALDAALSVAAASGGAFNPLVAPLLTAHGFPRGPAAPSPDRSLLDLAAIERRPGACRLARPGMALDFGGVAKGLAADRAAAAARAAAPNDFLLDAGGTLLGRGDWTVGIRDPLAPPGAPPLRAIPLPDATAAATSGNYERSLPNPDGSRTGHLFDPRTGRPAASGVLQVTVLAPSAALADAWSTALFVLGPDAASPDLLRTRRLAPLWVLSSPSGPPRLVSSPP